MSRRAASAKFRSRLIGCVKGAEVSSFREDRSFGILVSRRGPGLIKSLWCAYAILMGREYARPVFQCGQSLLCRAGRRTSMNILILATMAPLCGFYLYALVNFQRELRRTKRQEVPGAKTTPLCWRAGQLSAADPAISSATAPVEPEVAPGVRVAGVQVGGERKGGSPAISRGAARDLPVQVGLSRAISFDSNAEWQAKGSQRQVTPITSVRA